MRYVGAFTWPKLLEIGHIGERMGLSENAIICTVKIRTSKWNSALVWCIVKRTYPRRTRAPLTTAVYVPSYIWI